MLVLHTKERDQLGPIALASTGEMQVDPIRLPQPNLQTCASSIRSSSSSSIPRNINNSPSGPSRINNQHLQAVDPYSLGEFVSSVKLPYQRTPRNNQWCTLLHPCTAANLTLSTSSILDRVIDHPPQLRTCCIENQRPSLAGSFFISVLRFASISRTFFPSARRHSLH